jgi:hypothetical protein
MKSSMSSSRLSAGPKLQIAFQYRFRSLSNCFKGRRNDTISIAASAEFSNAKVHNVVVRSSAAILCCLYQCDVTA